MDWTTGRGRHCPTWTIRTAQAAARPKYTSRLTRHATPTTIGDVARAKRTYNLSERTIRIVRELSGRYGLGRSQDAVVEMAVDELERQLRDGEEARAWAAAADDPDFQRESERLEAAYRSIDAETWPA